MFLIQIPYHSIKSFVPNRKVRPRPNGRILCSVFAGFQWSSFFSNIQSLLTTWGFVIFSETKWPYLINCLFYYCTVITEYFQSDFLEEMVHSSLFPPVGQSLLLYLLEKEAGFLLQSWENLVESKGLIMISPLQLLVMGRHDGS